MSKRQTTIDLLTTLRLAGILRTLNDVHNRPQNVQVQDAFYLGQINALEKFISENIELTTEELFLLKHDKRILVIKSVRGRTGLSLSWAKATVDRCAPSGPPHQPHPCELFSPPDEV